MNGINEHSQSWESRVHNVEFHNLKVGMWYRKPMNGNVHSHSWESRVPNVGFHNLKWECGW